jgi:ADP-ribose pyrophosphatase YjhB (NUDIX family)
MNHYSKFQRHLVAVDCIIFGYDIIEKEIKLLLSKRIFEPAIGKWSLAGGFVDGKESLDQAACRILRNITGLESVYMRQSYSYGDLDRDTGDRVISVAYFALIAIRDINKDLAEQNGVHWRSIARLPDLIFDHPLMVKRALADLQKSNRLDLNYCLKNSLLYICRTSMKLYTGGLWIKGISGKRYFQWEYWKS